MQSLYSKYPELKMLEQNGDHRLEARKAVLRHAPKQAIGAEIGVFTGLFSDILAEEIPSQCIYLVDPWSKLHGTHFPNWGTYTAQVALSTHIAKEATLARAETADSKCVVVEDFGTDWLAKHENPFLSWVYLDANHSYASVMTDLNAISRCLLPDGVIMGDDMWVNANGKISDVYFAVRQFSKNAGFDLIHIDQYGQWAIKRAEAVDRQATPEQRKRMSA